MTHQIQLILGRLLVVILLTQVLSENLAAQAIPQVHKKFAKKVSVDVQDEPLGEFLSDLAAAHKVVIEIDKDALAADGFSVDDTITLSLADVSLFTAIQLASESAGLTCLPKAAGLVVTTRPEMMRQVYVVRYNYAELRPVRFDYGDLSDTLQCTTNGLWEEVDGVFDESRLRVGKHGQTGPFTIQILQCWEVHNQIARIFSDLKSVVRGQHGNQVDQSIFKGLQKKVEIDEDDLNLSDFLDELLTQNQINYWINKIELSNEGIEHNLQVQPASGKLTIAEHLDAALQPHGIVSYADGEVVKVTTSFAANEELVTRVYDIRKQVRQVGSVDAVIDFIMTTDGTGTWIAISQDGGDIGNIGPILVIKQSRSGHKKIANLLK